MMTELEFLNRFEHRPDGVWDCTKPINIKSPKWTGCHRPGGEL